MAEEVKKYPFDYESASVEEIEERLSVLREQRDSIKAELLFATQKKEEKLARESALRKIAEMSPAERRALGIPEPQTVAPDGIESEELVSQV